MDERERRIAENEILYRTVNEKIEGLNEAFGTLTDTMSIVCECGYESCTEQIELDVATYERVRSESTLFVILPGHSVADVESVVEQGDGFVIVRKDAGEAAILAAEHNPRG
jgi:hypothetical protein